jgi:hypothetical protein
MQALRQLESAAEMVFEKGLLTKTSIALAFLHKDLLLPV